MDVANLWHENGIPLSIPPCGDWLFFSFLSKNVQKILVHVYKTNTGRDFSRLFCVDVLHHHRWFTFGIGLSHPPGLDKILSDVKFGRYSDLKSEKSFVSGYKHSSIHLQSWTFSLSVLYKYVLHKLGWVVLRIYVALTVFQSYHMWSRRYPISTICSS